MCGIIIHFGDGDREEIVNAGLEAMKHRGLYQTIKTLNFVTIGHRRLPITDIHGRGHPYQIDQSLIWNVGEYYDTPDFHADTPELYRALQSPYKAQGMYSAIVHNVGTNVFYIFMDQLRKKPLYFRRDTKTIASEIKALTTKKLPKVTYDPNFDPIYETCYKEIIPLLGDCIVNVKEKKLSYINGKPPAHLKDNMSDLNLFTDALIKRIPSEVPWAMVVSGGLDSSLIYHQAKKHIVGNPRALHYKQKDDRLGYDLSKKLCGDDLIVLEEPESLDVPLRHLLYINESPLDFGSMIPQYNMFKALNERFSLRVIITGDGADELNWGYKRNEKADMRVEDLEELKYWHLPRLDKFGMWFGFEVRCPYLDDQVVRSSLNKSYYTHKGKKMIKDIANLSGLHPTIINRPKKPLKSSFHKTDKNYRKLLLETFEKHFSEGLHEHY